MHCDFRKPLQNKHIKMPKKKKKTTILTHLARRLTTGVGQGGTIIVFERVVCQFA
jgi:hypothetical protein